MIDEEKKIIIKLGSHIKEQSPSWLLLNKWPHTLKFLKLLLASFTYMMMFQ